MLKKSNIVLLALLFLCIACKEKAGRLENALQFAGGNRSELEKVLQHYSSAPADSLKYRAAVFLIENMPYYYSTKNDKLELYQKELYRTAIDNDCTGEDAFRRLEQKYGALNPSESEIVYDAHIITAGYLMKNIEQAFKVWQERPWGKHLAFDDFCEQILPYRIKNEPLEDWREAYYNRFQPALDSLPADTENPVEAVQALWKTMNSQRWVYWDKKPHGYELPGALPLLDDCLIGDCYALANRSIYILRALGIPCSIEGYLQFPYGQGHHLWNAIPGIQGHTWEFSLNAYPPRPAKRDKPVMGSVFRHCFGVQQESLPVLSGGRKDLPPLLNSAFIRNVSENYLHDVSLTIKAGRWKKKDNILYLCTFGFENWAPVSWTFWQDGEFTFRSVEKDMLYLPAYYKNGQLIPAGPPCYVNQYGIQTVIEADSRHERDLLVTRKYPKRGVWESYNKRIINGKFQAANDSAFTEPVTLHTVKEASDMLWKVLKFSELPQYRYFRYLSGNEGHCNMAEVQLIGANGEMLKGEVIGTDGSYQNRKDNNRLAVFDGDPLTFFDALEGNGAWAGLDLGKPETVREIRYVFRNDDNNIRIGDTYELFYWDNQWHSLGQQTAAEGWLKYEKASAGALLWLHNHTRGKEERPFVYVGGEQIFVSE